MVADVPGDQGQGTLERVMKKPYIFGILLPEEAPAVPSDALLLTRNKSPPTLE